MTQATETVRPAPVLDPIDRTSEVLFGLFMALTFTGTLSVATAGRGDVREMLIAAIGCNLAWGFVDAVMYVLRDLVTQGRRLTFYRAVQRAGDSRQAHALIAERLRGTIDGLGPKGLEALHEWARAQPAALVQRPRLTGTTLRGALMVFVLVTASTFPPVLPFVFFVDDLVLAKRVSAAAAISMMFLCGYGWGRHAGARPVAVGLAMVCLGVLVEGVVIALGG